jgi:hypothetical protein
MFLTFLVTRSWTIPRILARIFLSPVSQVSFMSRPRTWVFFWSEEEDEGEEERSCCSGV